MTQVVFIGEAHGEHEAFTGVPFVGLAGQELMRLLSNVGFPCPRLPYNEISSNSMILHWDSFPYPILNVFNERPESNNVELFYGSRRDDVDLSLPVRKFGSSSKYVLKSTAHHVRALHAALERLAPNLICPLGATACWALGLGASIGRLRGFVHETKWGKALPTYHPSAVIQNWSLRFPTLVDLTKARREMQFPEIRVIDREIWTEPTINDLWHWWEKYGQHSKCLGFDIETIRQQQVSEVGFAADPHHALHIPFCIEHRVGNSKSYQQWWPDISTEVEAWKFVRHVCKSNIPKIGQNGAQYDCFWMARTLGIPVRNYIDDTMTLAHAWMPEMSKGLYDLGAMFLDEKSWKSIRKDSGKGDD